MSVRPLRRRPWYVRYASTSRSLLPCNRSLLPYNRSLLTLTHTSYVRYASISRSLLPCNRSLLLYNRSLLTLPHTSYVSAATAPKDVVLVIGLFCLIIGLFWHLRIRQCGHCAEGCRDHCRLFLFNEAEWSACEGQGRGKDDHQDTVQVREHIL